MALAVFAGFALAAGSMTIGSLETAGSNRERVRAANLAAEEVERVRARFRVAPGAVGSDCLTRASAEVDLRDGRYTLRCTATWLGDDLLTAGPAGSPYTAANGSILRVEVTVTWPDMGQIKPVINSTLLS